MTIDHINAQSILSNREEILLLVKERDMDVLCISETWLCNDIPHDHINIPEYKVFRCDKGRGGGVCIYVKDIFKVTPLEFDTVRPQGVEDVWVTVQSCKFPTIIVGCLYRHPKSLSQTYDYITDVIKSVSLKNKHFYILGDFNDNILSNNSKMKQIIANSKLKQVIIKPTRITPTSATLLDLVITNKSESILHSDTIPCPVADHELVTVTVNLQKPKRSPIVKTFRDLTDYSPNTLCSLLSQHRRSLNQIFVTDDTNIQVNIFTEIFNKCINECAPLVTREVRRPFAPWIDEHLRALIRERNTTQKNLKNDRLNVVLQLKYKRLKGEVKKLLYKTKSDYYSNKLETNKSNSAATWNTLRQLMPANKHTSPLELNSDCEAVKNKAETFNNFFANVGRVTFEKSQQSHEDNGNVPLRNNDSNMNPSSCDIFRPQPTDSDTIILIIKHLKNTSSCGSDNIPLRFIKESLPAIITYLTCIINTSIVTGIFPERWKHAIVVPIFKTGDVMEPKDYRPISLLPIISKVLEKVVASQLTSHLESNQLLSTTQHGFRPKLSTESALLKLSNTLFETIDKRNVSLVTLCDLSKAFDSVNHEILINKLNVLRIDSFWFQSYLHNRTQSVKIGQHVSKKFNVSYGVPQGSVLGPILFSIFVNDLSQHIPDCLIIQYADDTQLIHTGNINSINDLVHRGETSLRQAKSYFNANGLLLNTTKTQCMFIGSSGLISQIPPNTCLQVDGNNIFPSNHLKNLGIYFDSHMTFDTHVNKIHKKIFSTILYINRIKNNLNRSARVTVMQTLVLSIINYGLKIWGTTNITQTHKIQKLQNFAAKVALGGGAKRDHATPFLKELGWLRVHQKYKYELGIITYNIMNSNVPSHLFSMPRVSDVCTVPTRQQSNLYVPKTNTSTGARSLMVAGPKFWNSLPSSIKNAQSTRTFKKNLFKHLLNEQFIT